MARLRAEQIDRGLDLTFSKVFVPYFQDRLTDRGAIDVLEAGGGTGHLARELVSLTNTYVLLEPSNGMFSVATEVLNGSPVEVRNESLEMFAQRGRTFDRVLSHMCIQTVSDLDGFLQAVASVLSPGGRFTVSLPHPAFYNAYKQFFPREEFSYIREQNGTISFSVTLDPGREISGVPYYHRPLSRYVTSIARAGLCVTRLDEIYPTADIQALYGHPWADPRYVVFEGNS